MSKKAIIMQKLAQRLKSLDAHEEWEVCQLQLLRWFGPPGKFKKALRRIRRFAERYRLPFVVSGMEPRAGNILQARAELNHVPLDM